LIEFNQYPEDVPQMSWEPSLWTFSALKSGNPLKSRMALNSQQKKQKLQFITKGNLPVNERGGISASNNRVLLSIFLINYPSNLQLIIKRNEKKKGKSEKVHK